jgi:ornithine decarboxylase
MPELFLTASAVQSLVRKYGSPLLVLHRKRLIHQVDQFRRLLPRVELFYAVKANPHPEILKTLVKLGTSFEVASGGEIEAVRALKVDPDKILFANTVKKMSGLKTAQQQEVSWMTFDHEHELEKIAAVVPRAKVILRLKVPNINSVVDLSLKFGADATRAVPLFQFALQKGLEPTGVSFHVGSQCLNTINYGKAIEIAAGVFRQSARAGIPLSVLDIGGGFPIPYVETVSVPSFPDIARKINHSLTKHFADRRIRVVAEPGRFICGPAVNLICSVMGSAPRDNKQWYTVDDGLYGSFSGIMFDQAQYTFVPFRKGNTAPSVLAGPSCDSLDIIAKDLYLPSLRLGDVLAVPSMGAYSSAHATVFNGFPLTKLIVIDG